MNAETQGRRIAYFVPDCTDSAVCKRVLALQSLGLHITTCSFRRRRYNSSFVPFWDDVALGTIEDRAYLQRLLLIVVSVVRLLRARKRIRDCDAWWARNLDLALLALLMRWLTRSRAPLVYEVLDIQAAFTGDSLRSRVLRAVERFVLRRCSVLVLSSPAFHREYFARLQRFEGPWHLVENKIFPCPDEAGVAQAWQAPRSDSVWTIGWFGTLRCARSLALLCALADRFPDRVRIDLRGYPKRIGMDVFRASVERRPNMIYGGEYDSRRDLADLYAGVHLNWCADFSDADANSLWLIPNRIYEGGIHGVPALAFAGTETGRLIEHDALGFALTEATEDCLIEFVGTLDRTRFEDCRESLAAVPASRFCGADDLRVVLEALWRA